MKQTYNPSDHFKIFPNYLSQIECFSILEETHNLYDEGEIFNLALTTKIHKINKDSLNLFSSLLKHNVKTISLPSLYNTASATRTQLPQQNYNYTGIITLKEFNTSADIDTFNEVYGGEINFITHMVTVVPRMGTLILFKNIPNNLYKIEKVSFGTLLYAQFGLT